MRQNFPLKPNTTYTVSASFALPAGSPAPSPSPSPSSGGATVGSFSFSSPALGPTPGNNGTGPISGAAFTLVKNYTFGTTVTGANTDPTIKNRTDFANNFRTWYDMRPNRTSGAGGNDYGVHWSLNAYPPEAVGGPNDPTQINFSNVGQAVINGQSGTPLGPTPYTPSTFDFHQFTTNSMKCMVGPKNPANSTINGYGDLGAGFFCHDFQIPDMAALGRDLYWEFQMKVNPASGQSTIPGYYFAYWLDNDSGFDNGGDSGELDVIESYAQSGTFGGSAVTGGWTNVGHSTVWNQASTVTFDIDLKQTFRYALYLGKNRSYSTWVYPMGGGTGSYPNNTWTQITSGTYRPFAVPLSIFFEPHFGYRGLGGGMDISTPFNVSPSMPFNYEISWTRFYQR